MKPGTQPLKTCPIPRRYWQQRMERRLVFRLTHPQRFAGSQLLIVANGAPFLNGSLVMPLQQRIAEKLIDSCLPAERVALLAYADAGLLISAAAEADPRGAGLEMFTVWPLSAITVPALLLGLVACAMLLPTLGRPQRLAGQSVSDFGLHVDALGRLLYGARDLAYSRSCIAEYFQRVRGEPPPAWLESPDDTVALPASPASAAPVNAVLVDAVLVDDGPVTAGQWPTAKPSPPAQTGNSQTGNSQTGNSERRSQSVPGQSEPQRGGGSE